MEEKKEGLNYGGELEGFPPEVVEKMKIKFTHYWVSEFGWENTILLPVDFIEVEKLGESEKDDIVFIATNDVGGKHILKGRYVK